MQFISLSAQYRQIKDSISEELLKSLSAQNFTAGHQVAELEKLLADYVGVSSCISCSDGTDALFACLTAFGIKKGDGVIIPVFASETVARGVIMCGAVPVFADINDRTYTIDPECVKRLFDGSDNIKAIVAVDTFGVAADYDAICSAAKKHGALVIECAFESFGGSVNGKKCGSFADAAVTSFEREMPLGCYSNGGAIFVNNGDIAKKCRSVLSDMQSYLSPLEATVLKCKLDVLDFEIVTRGLAADCYKMFLEGVLKLPEIPDGIISAYAQYTVKCISPEQREQLISGLRERYVPTRIYYKEPLYNKPEFKEYGKGDCPVCERCCERVLSLPMHPYLNDRMIKTICDAVKASL